MSDLAGPRPGAGVVALVVVAPLGYSWDAFCLHLHVNTSLVLLLRQSPSHLSHLSSSISQFSLTSGVLPPAAFCIELSVYFMMP